jgi:hypothetical protein
VIFCEQRQIRCVRNTCTCSDSGGDPRREKNGAAPTYHPMCCSVPQAYQIANPVLDASTIVESKFHTCLSREPVLDTLSRVRFWGLLLDVGASVVGSARRYGTRAENWRDVTVCGAYSKEWQKGGRPGTERSSVHVPLLAPRSGSLRGGPGTPRRRAMAGALHER